MDGFPNLITKTLNFNLKNIIIIIFIIFINPLLMYKNCTRVKLHFTLIKLFEELSCINMTMK
jgi:hypothetical protein